ncbi:transmembrane and coiled-coil domain-containing protein 3-like [Bolinopsis microptera]|uniref:transmembrane and coiled-coil domain-containing protein 3-like n=1 Tax=Bolinopsis microptera TaxID=2820187 RepID=UPI0030790F23
MVEEEKFDKLELVLGQIRDIHFDDEEHNIFYDIIQDVLTDVESAADLLEENLRERIVPIRAQDIETVRKLESKSDDDLSVNLEDVHGNRYVISLPADKTQPLHDNALLFSILIMLVLAGILSGLCHVCHVPTIFGQILAGVILGPSCLNLILDPVQTETVGELGVFLILFSCGLEFSPASFVKVWRVISGFLGVGPPLNYHN